MLTEKFYEAAKIAGCEYKVLNAKEIIAYLSENKTRNVAILGETNSGKTTLINRLCGKEVRAATKLSMGEKPLKVVFASIESDDNYEIVSLDSGNNAGLTFNEIPFNMAVDYDSKAPTEMLEKMDVVIYVVSAVMPMTASDVENITNLMDKFPVIIYISKIDMLDNTDDAAEVTEYVKNIAAKTFENGEIPIFSSGDDSVDSIMDILKEMEVDGIREYHIGRIATVTKQNVVEALNDKLASLKEIRKQREKEVAATEDEARDEKLAWDKLRLDMLEHCQETIDTLDKKLSMIKISAKQELQKQFKEVQNKKEWLKVDLKELLTEKLENAACSIYDEARDITTSHSNWFISKVNLDYNMKISVEDLKCYYSTSTVKVSECDDGPNRQKMYLAAGSGIVAGAAILSSIPILPTCIIAIPASLLTVAFLKGGIDDCEKYNKEVMEFIDKTCENNFSKLTSEIHSTVNEFYEKIVESMHGIVLGKTSTVSFADIDEEENAIKQMLNEIK